MERIQKTDTAFPDDSVESPPPPRFTRGAARKAQQVVALRPLILRPLQRLWTSLGTGSHRARVITGIILFAIAGGVAGGLLATASNNSERAIDAESVTAGANASAQNDNAEPLPGSRVGPSKLANPWPASEFEGPGLDRMVAELRKRRPHTKAKKAYRVAVIYPDVDDDFDHRRKRGRKH
jgi:hypothetical protein